MKRAIWTGLCAMLVASTGPALASGDPYAPIDELVAREAYSLARFALMDHELPRRGEDAHRHHYLSGLVLRRLGEIGSASLELRAIPPSSLWYPRGRRILAGLYRAQGLHQDADACMREWIAQTEPPERDHVRMELADQLYSRGEYEQARKLYQEQVDRGIDRVLGERAAFNVGWCYERLGLPARAVFSWKAAIERHPQSKQAGATWVTVANRQLRIDRPLLASDALSRAARLRGGDPELEARASFLAAEGYASKGNWDQAATLYRGITHPSWTEPARYGLAYAQWQLGQVREARTGLEHWLDEYPRSRARPAASLALGRILLDLDLPGPARARIEEARAYGSTGIREQALFLLAQLDYQDGKADRCLERARELLSTYPKSKQRGRYRWLLAESLLALHRPDEAVREYQALERENDDLSFLDGKGDAVAFRIGLAQFRNGDHAAAALTLRDIARRSAYEAEASYWLAEACYRSGDLQGAANAYESHLNRFPSGDKAGEAAYGAGYAHLGLKQPELAARSFKRAIPLLRSASFRQDAQVQLARIQLFTRDWTGASATFGSLFTSQLEAPLLADVLYGLAYAGFRAGGSADTETHARDFLRRFPGDARRNRIRDVAAQLAFRAGRYEDAIDSLRQIIGDDGATRDERREARYRIAAAHFNAGHLDEARTGYQALHDEAASGSVEQQEYAQWLTQALIGQDRMDEARTLATRHGGASWSTAVLERIGRTQLSRGQGAEARKTLMLIASPGLAQRFLLAEAEWQSGEPEAALSQLDALSREPSPDQAAWTRLYAERAIARNLPGAAMEAWWRLTRLNVSETELSRLAFAAGRAAMQGGQDELALRTFRTLAARPGASPATVIACQSAIGKLAMRRGNWNEAIAAHRVCLKLGKPTDPKTLEARYWLGAALVAAQRQKEAIPELEKVAGTPRVAVELLGLTWLKLGEAYELERRWDEASKLYRTMTARPDLGNEDRETATARLKWIEDHVTRRMPR